MERSQDSFVLFVGSLEPKKLISRANPAGRVFFPIEQGKIQLDMALAQGVRLFSRLEILSVSRACSSLRILPFFTSVPALCGQHLENLSNPSHELLMSLG